MSNISAQYWSESALATLRSKEQSCKESDLFCVGYLIPQVELVEVEYSGQLESTKWWQSKLVEYVRQNMAHDKMQPSDVETVERLMAEL